MPRTWIKGKPRATDHSGEKMLDAHLHWKRWTQERRVSERCFSLGAGWHGFLWSGEVKRADAKRAACAHTALEAAERSNAWSAATLWGCSGEAAGVPPRVWCAAAATLVV